MVARRAELGAKGKELSDAKATQSAAQVRSHRVASVPQRSVSFAHAPRAPDLGSGRAGECVDPSDLASHGTVTKRSSNETFSACLTDETP